MKKLLLIFIMMATWTVVGCETVRQIKAGCFGYWMYTDGFKRGTRLDNQNNNRPYRQCVDENAPHANLEKRPYG
jgi:hypothetical protein